MPSYIFGAKNRVSQLTLQAIFPSLSLPLSLSSVFSLFQSPVAADLPAAASQQQHQRICT